MKDEDEIGTMRSAKADRERIERGMLISFDSDIRRWTPADMLLVTTPAGEPINLHPTTVEGDRLYVMATIHPAMNLRFWLDRIDAKTARLDMEDHHVGILQGHYARIAAAPSAKGRNL
jgi:hypothetical protein